MLRIKLYKIHLSLPHPSSYITLTVSQINCHLSNDAPPYLNYDINAAAFVSILVRHTGHFNLIFVAQSSHKHTWPHGKQIT